ncbi:MAG: hypothetical protein A3B66_04475 [Alphaproteobacteria bacterium RIFCSPHIGHO2_02_FULL_46_13]|nr:MAG: hypothetical protein A3B66_04475 [Alphaproteobacteria bacterium RIFCSPHIGHO2_02_FULL_46_13]
MEKPKLSIVCVTYNHEKYIRAALDSFLSQKTNFAFEILIGDDASTDSTPDIIREYAEKYPDIIKPVLRQKNVGPGANSIDLYNRVKTEYMAICDGDDYWTSPHKLQMQVDFLDNNKDYNICFHPVECFFENLPKSKHTFFPNKLTHPQVFAKPTLTLKDIAQGNFIQSSSVVYRWKFAAGLPAWYGTQIMPGDWCIMLLHADTGHIKLINECMAVYRRHASGIWWKISASPIEYYNKYGLDILEIYKQIDQYWDSKYTHLLRPILIGNLSYLILSYQNKARQDGIEELRKYIATNLKNYNIPDDIFSRRNLYKTRLKLLMKRLLNNELLGLIKKLYFSTKFASKRSE